MQLVNKVDFEDNSLPFPDGSERIILRTPQEDISFIFSETDFEIFKETINEAHYISEVYALMQ